MTYTIILDFVHISHLFVFSLLSACFIFQPVFWFYFISECIWNHFVRTPHLRVVSDVW